MTLVTTGWVGARPAGLPGPSGRSPAPVAGLRSPSSAATPVGGVPAGLPGLGRADAQTLVTPPAHAGTASPAPGPTGLSGPATPPPAGLPGSTVPVVRPPARAPAPAGDPADAPLTPAPPRTLEPYRGLATWASAYGYSPEFQSANRPPRFTPSTVDAIAAAGVHTLFLQAAKDDTRSPGLLVDPPVLADILVRAHADGLEVVAWYLPKFYDLDSDLRRIVAMRDFRADGQGFDGIGIDIEWREDVPDDNDRSARLVELSRRAREAMGHATLAAIPLPPVLTEVVNPKYWPGFPWRAIAPYYDVWQPMGYWTFRKRSSPYRDAYRYTVENVDRLRADIGRPDAAVHAVGGTDNRSTDADYRGFVRACADAHVIGGSIYDWLTTPATAWPVLRSIR